jgi:membrane dipeptidase
MVVDLSHCGTTTTVEALYRCELPPVFSHANSRQVFDSPRNKTREELLLLAEKGGVVGPNFWSPMLRSDRQPDMDDFSAQLSYLVDLLGPAHVGFATDHSEGSDRERWEALFGRGGEFGEVTGSMGSWYGYDTRYVRGFESVTSLPRLAGELMARGFDSDSVRAILGESFLKVFETVWRK